MSSIITRVFDYLGSGRWSTEEVEIGGGGSQTGEVPQTPTILEPCRWLLWADKQGAYQTIPDYTYNNGAAGVGSTITANANGALLVGAVGAPGYSDITPDVGDRIAFADQYNEVWGVFTVTDVGDGSNPWVLTRATDVDTPETFCSYWVTLVTPEEEDQDLDPFDYPPLVFASSGVDEYMTVEQASTGGNLFELSSLYGAVLGKGALAIGVEPTAVGYCTTAVGPQAVAIGPYAYALKNGFAFGLSSKATEDGATALGYHAEATVAGQTVVHGTEGTIVAMTGGKAGFFGTTPIEKPTISNATAADVIAALAALGLVVDDT